MTAMLTKRIVLCEGKSFRVAYRFPTHPRVVRVDLARHAALQVPRPPCVSGANLYFLHFSFKKDFGQCGLLIGEFDRANDLKWRLGQAAPCQLDKSSRGLYWIGNLCIDGERAKGNFPRSPLVIARLQEEPFGLVRDSFTVIDRRAPHEDPRVQHSNFRMYQDRANGDVVLFLTRYGERGHDGKNWLRADQYEYRVAIE